MGSIVNVLLSTDNHIYINKSSIFPERIVDKSILYGVLLYQFPNYNNSPLLSPLLMKKINAQAFAPHLLEILGEQIGPSAGPILVRAFETKQILTSEITSMLLPAYRKGDKLAQAIASVSAIFRQYDIKITFSSLPRNKVEKTENKAEVLQFTQKTENLPTKKHLNNLINR